MLRIHPGAKANIATFSTFGWQQQYALEPGQNAAVELPRMDGGVVPLTISAADGFYPHNTNPGSSDHRFLGVWVEVAPSAKTAADQHK
jgi:hypothetical protein